jgi:hypothetical protein
MALCGWGYAGCWRGTSGETSSTPLAEWSDCSASLGKLSSSRARLLRLSIAAWSSSISFSLKKMRMLSKSLKSTLENVLPPCAYVTHTHKQAASFFLALRAPNVASCPLGRVWFTRGMEEGGARAVSRLPWYLSLGVVAQDPREGGSCSLTKGSYSLTSSSGTPLSTR